MTGSNRRHLTRRDILRTSAAFTVAPGLAYLASADFAAAQAPPAEGGRITLGLAGLNYYNGFNPLLNWWKTGDVAILTLRSGERINTVTDVRKARAYVDPDTLVIEPAGRQQIASISRVFFSPVGEFQTAIGADFAGEEWIAEWDGDAKVSVQFSGDGYQTSPQPGMLRFRLGRTPGGMALNIVPQRDGMPPHNFRVYQARYRAAIAANQAFNPDWLHVVSQFGMLRLVDWMATNFSGIVDFQDIATERSAIWGRKVSSAEQAAGLKGGVPLSLIAALASETRKPIHVCLPHMATDECIRGIAEFFRKSVATEVTYEYSNECWNPGFTQFHYCSKQGEAYWPGAGDRHARWYGFRAAQCMSIVNDVYKDRSRWRGALATHTANVYATDMALEGINYWRKQTAEAGNIAVADLFRDLCVTGYFGDGVQAWPVESLSPEPAAMTIQGRAPFKAGETLRIFLANGTAGPNGLAVKVTSDAKDSSVALEAIDAATWPPFAKGNNYVTRSLVFDIMDESERLFAQGRRPSKYDYFNEQIAEACLNGKSSAGYATPTNVRDLIGRLWPAHQKRARAAGLELRQYEGGCHFLGNSYLQGARGNARFDEFLFHLGKSPQIAAVYDAMFKGFAAFGAHAAKYVEAGPDSRFGTWSGVRFWPTAANGNRDDTENPVWQVVMKANRAR